MINYDALGKGRICRIEYDAEVPVKAVYKKAGIKIIKHVSTTVRTGVSYSNLPNVINKRGNESEETSSKKRTNNFEWVIKNVLTHNTNTNKDYLYVAPFKKNSRTKISYTIEVEGDRASSIVENMINECVLDSYKNRKGYCPEIMTICVDNIRKINGEIVQSIASPCRSEIQFTNLYI